MQNKRVALNERDHFKEPFERTEIESLLQGKPASVMFSFKSPSFRALGSKPEALKDRDLVNLMLKEPRLIRRPVVRIDRKVDFGAGSIMISWAGAGHLVG